MKKVLVVTYSQSGQLNEIVSGITNELSSEILIHHEKIETDPIFPFPWKGISFYDAMPESVTMKPSRLKPVTFNSKEKFDLIVLGYPIWFLSPAIPLTTFLKTNEAKQVMNNTPVITVIGARNMWVMAQEEIKKMIIQNNGKLVGNIALHDRNYNLTSVVTIIYWMVTGKKDRYLGIFPKPGVSDKDIHEVNRFSPIISEAVIKSDFGGLQEKLLELKSVELSPAIVSIEEKGKRIFRVWASFILKKGGVGSPNRVARLKMFKWYLMFVIFLISPIATLVFYITWPLFFIRIKKKQKYYRGVELKSC